MICRLLAATAGRFLRTEKSKNLENQASENIENLQNLEPLLPTTTFMWVTVKKTSMLYNLAWYMKYHQNLDVRKSVPEVSKCKLLWFF